MRYLLVVGFTCEVYRRLPQARIYVNNQLIDEFLIEHRPDNYFIEYNKFLQPRHRLQPVPIFTLSNLYTQNFPCLKLYELEINKEIQHLYLHINIENNDSNYLNGFMTQSTLIKINTCYFFPLNKRLLDRLNQIKNKKKFTKNYAWYLSCKNCSFDLLVNGMHWHGADGKIMKHSFKNYLKFHNIGGNGFFSCRLTKKYGILMPVLLRSCRLNYNMFDIDYYLDKYFQYANQRNSN